MNRDPIRHPWNLPLRRAAGVQTDLSKFVSLVPLTITPRTVVGIDSAERNDHLFIAAVCMDVIDNKVIDITHAHSIVKDKYISGYRAFREGPLILKAIKRLYYEPDLLIFHGYGVCHPRMLGLASHIGLWLDLPSIGVAEKRLIGHYDPPGEKRGDYSIIRYSPQAPGVVLRTREGVKPVFVSPGHKIDLLGAIEQTLRLASPYRLPEPLRRAHIEAGKDMRRFLTGGKK
ncbi:MAG: endonuclease V [Candidatus Zixiibacteriota bacterium]